MLFDLLISFLCLIICCIVTFLILVWNEHSEKFEKREKLIAKYLLELKVAKGTNQFVCSNIVEDTCLQLQAEKWADEQMKEN